MCWTLVLSAAPQAARAQLPAYTLLGSYTLPAGADAWDVGPDGRVLALVGSQIVRQSAPNASTYAPLGSLPAGTVSSFGASFLRVNSDGVLAIGDGNFGDSSRVHFVELPQLSTGAPTPTRSLLLGNFSAAWNGSNLFVAGAGLTGSPFVARVEYSDAAIPLSSSQVMSGIGGASGGVAISGPTLYTGVGFGGGGFVAGDLRSFSVNALTVTDAVFPYSTGSLVPGSPIFSASPLATDPLGNLYVGDGRFGTDAASGVVAIDPDTGDRLTLAPAGGNRNYGVNFNLASTELLVSTGGTVYRYAIPAPGLAGALMLAGVVTLGSRRRG